MATKFAAIEQTPDLKPAMDTLSALIKTIKKTLPAPFPESARHRVEVIVGEHIEVSISLAGRFEPRDQYIMKMTHGMIPGYRFKNIRATRDHGTIGRHSIIARVVLPR